MKNSLFYRCTPPVALIILLFLLPGCKKEEQAAPDPNAIPSNAVRIRATISAPGTEPTDVYRAVGNFFRPNYYNPAGNIYVMKKQPDGTYTIDISTAEVVDGPGLILSISRNGQFMERNPDCSKKIDRNIPMTPILGKEFGITVVAFQGTGSCPP